MSGQCWRLTFFSRGFVPLNSQMLRLSNICRVFHRRHDSFQRNDKTKTRRQSCKENLVAFLEPRFPYATASRLAESLPTKDCVDRFFRAVLVQSTKRM